MEFYSLQNTYRTINILDSKINRKGKYTRMQNTALTFFRRMNKKQPFFSKFYPVYNKELKHIQDIFTNFRFIRFTNTTKNQNRQHLYISDLEFRQIHKYFRVTILSIKYMKKNTNSDIFSLHVFNNSPYKTTLPLGLLGYCEPNATTSPQKK